MYLPCGSTPTNTIAWTVKSQSEICIFSAPRPHSIHAKHTIGGLLVSFAPPLTSYELNKIIHSWPHLNDKQATYTLEDTWTYATAFKNFDPIISITPESTSFLLLAVPSAILTWSKDAEAPDKGLTEYLL
ncbi:uncharacterized protein MELLADRAFT_107108 [Melampsora larici-populina 98AG31]|uniref:Uncharacterized protein n=1 Tax=Melampsora larici-populina (strain 98AG31 / pathotype 3-4-7) TaxID=747676 RepID=F4RNP8_MELLP|nr:uncharacterized protein MELLADRAFT_107108 [Melampsora larici-populina 98AG31]EGG06057.1 hypothetical protein MELLADRAFT_107108 [Melampsora larici-populina 98AG31]